MSPTSTDSRRRRPWTAAAPFSAGAQAGDRHRRDHRVVHHQAARPHRSGGLLGFAVGFTLLRRAPLAVTEPRS